MDVRLQTTNKLKHIPPLDGLRGLAILLVITYHYFGFISIFSFGWSGVDLFFVLSGFLITGKLLDTVNNKHYFLHFFRNRILRIFPLYYITLILFFGAVFILAKNEHLGILAFYREHWVSFFVFLQNWTFIFHGFPADKYLTHFWSLAVEEQFYIFWPFVIYFIKNERKLLKILLFIILLVIVTRSLIYIKYQENGDYARYYYNSFCRMDSFIIGALISLVYHFKISFLSKTINIFFYASLFLIGIGIVLFGSSAISGRFFPTVGYTLNAILYATLLFKTIQLNSFLYKLFKVPLLRFCGKISYALYIFHWPVRLIIGVRLYNWGMERFPGNPSLFNYLSLFICLLLTFMISAISFYYFESYFLRLKK